MSGGKRAGDWRKTKNIDWLKLSLGLATCPFDNNTLEDNFELDALLAELIAFFEQGTPWDSRTTEVSLELSSIRLRLKSRMLDQIIGDMREPFYFRDEALESVWRDFRFADNLRGCALAGAGTEWAKDGKAEKARKKILPILLDLVESNLGNNSNPERRKYCLKVLKDARNRYSNKNKEHESISGLLKKHFPEIKI